MIDYSLVDIIFYLFLYSFIGWCIEVCVYAVKEKKFVNRGLFNLPLSFPYGISAILLIISLPTLNHQLFMQYIIAFFTFMVVWKLSSYFLNRISHTKADLKFPFNNIEHAKELIFIFFVSLVLL
ncbi:MAG: putative ABC transporter permease, partial [Traorella sp.]